MQIFTSNRVKATQQQPQKIESSKMQNAKQQQIAAKGKKKCCEDSIRHKKMNFLTRKKTIPIEHKFESSIPHGSDKSVTI